MESSWAWATSMWVIIIIIITDIINIIIISYPGGPAVQGVGLRPLAYWDCGFESLRGQGYVYPLGVLCCQVEVSATYRSLVQSRPTERERERESARARASMTVIKCYSNLVTYRKYSTWRAVKTKKERVVVVVIIVVVVVAVVHFA